MSIFHLSNGLFFQRQEEGNVRIIYAPKGEFIGINEISNVIEDFEVTPEEWASCVASVSKRGETSGTWAVARNFHNKEE